ncbi:MAG: SUF system Fe-S cluster assembly regulator [Gammaproteobacteria bacterium]|nr:MAG: SUF system Fe-S cluster assembly regulator [Gammaproteobacteria bacterium]
MLRIGKLTDYAMLILSQMAKEPHVVLSATSLADKLHLMPPTVSKVLKILSDGGLVSSVRGAEGGYHLAREAATITVSDVITAMEGQVAMTECCESPGLCGIDTLCTMRENWLKINSLISSLLRGLTIADLLKPLSPLQVIQGLHYEQ